jgi:hypothetical protein
MIEVTPGRDYYSFILSPNMVGVIKRTRGNLWRWHIENRGGVLLGPEGITCRSPVSAYAEMMRKHDQIIRGEGQ